MRNSDIERAKTLLAGGNYTCVLCKGNTEFHSHTRGVRPLLDFLETGRSFAGFSAADKTVGAGAAYLYVLLGVTCVWANRLSESAKQVLQKHGIAVSFQQLVPQIDNRTRDGICPIEEAANQASSPEEALAAIKQTLISLSQK